MTPAKHAYTESALPEEEERNRALMEHLPQVRYIARHIHDRLPQHVSLEDLVHAGILGLIDAMQKYDGNKNVQFKTYAKFRIRGAILDSLRELDWGPRDLRRKARRLEEVASRLGSELGRSASEPELAAEFGVSLEEFQHMLGELGDSISAHCKSSPARADARRTCASTCRVTRRRALICSACARR